jgi:DNA-binding response OmpR family regulator
MDTFWHIYGAMSAAVTWLRSVRRKERPAPDKKQCDEPREGKPPAKSPRTALRILTVDDEPSIAACLSLIFERPRYELTSARNGNDALARVSAARSPYDVVITDNEMPQVSGIQLVRELRERSFRGKIVVLSGDLTNETRDAYAQMKVDAILDKPFDNYELRSRLDLLVA